MSRNTFPDNINWLEFYTWQKTLTEGVLCEFSMLENPTEAQLKIIKDLKSWLNDINVGLAKLKQVSTIISKQ